LRYDGKNIYQLNVLFRQNRLNKIHLLCKIGERQSNIQFVQYAGIAPELRGMAIDLEQCKKDEQRASLMLTSVRRDSNASFSATINEFVVSKI
jgi:hypothetical protein